MSSEIKISIILPTLNGARYIRQTIESIISQTLSDWELIIVNDGSNDSSEDIVNEYAKNDSRIVYLKNEVNQGIQKSSNRGLKEAKGKYIARIDDDDEWIDKGKLQKQLEFLEHNTEYVLVGTGVVVTDENNIEMFRTLTPITDAKIRNIILSRNCFINSSVLFRKEAILKLGGYSEEKTIKHIEDYDLCLKLGLVGKLYNLPIYATRFTSRKNSISSINKMDQFKKNVDLIKGYKNKYPRYLFSLIYSYSRIILYTIFKLIPFVSLKYKIIKLYKEF